MWMTAYAIGRIESPEVPRPISHNYNTEKYTVIYCSLDICLAKGQDCLFCPDVLKKNTSSTTGMRYEEYVYWPITDYTVC